MVILATGKCDECSRIWLFFSVYLKLVFYKLGAPTGNLIKTIQPMSYLSQRNFQIVPCIQNVNYSSIR